MGVASVVVASCVSSVGAGGDACAAEASSDALLLVERRWDEGDGHQEQQDDADEAPGGVVGGQVQEQGAGADPRQDRGDEPAQHAEVGVAAIAPHGQQVPGHEHEQNGPGGLLGR